jgi:hypothetical protein
MTKLQKLKGFLVRECAGIEVTTNETLQTLTAESYYHKSTFEIKIIDNSILVFLKDDQVCTYEELINALNRRIDCSQCMRIFKAVFID